MQLYPLLEVLGKCPLVKAQISKSGPVSTGPVATSLIKGSFIDISCKQAVVSIELHCLQSDLVIPTTFVPLVSVELTQLSDHQIHSDSCKLVSHVYLRQ